MREILFRGKIKNNSKWICGDLSTIAHKCYIDDRLKNMERVDPETVGQFIGLTDKNGIKIFEGDILKSPFDKKFFEVFYDECRFFVKTNRGTVLRGVQSAIDHYELEVIGNIYDNPELLEAK